MNNLMQEWKQDFTLLLEAGFIAVKQCNEPEAIALFAAAQTLSPKNLFPQVGLAYMYLCMLNLPKATEILEKVVHQEPHNEVAQTLLGVATSFMPKKTAEGEKILQEQLDHSEDPFVKKAADTALSFVEKHIKKNPSPVEKKTHSTPHKKSN